jgi:tetratricopeptide (TPR) repeat protein
MLALAQLAREHDNLRLALRWLVTRGDVERAQRLAGALHRFWMVRAHLAEGEAWLRQALALPGGERQTAARAACVYALGSLLEVQGAYDASELHLREALSLFRAAGNRAGEGWTLMGLGQAARLRGDHAAARVLLEEGIAVSREAGQSAPESTCRVMLADVAYEQGQVVEARAQAEAALTSATAAGWLVGVANARRVAGKVEFAEGNATAARVHLEASLAAARELGSGWMSAQALARLGPVAIKLGDVEPACAYLIQSLQVAGEQAPTAGMVRGELCLTLEGFAQLGVVLGRHRAALELAGAAGALREQWNAPLSPIDRSLLDQALSRAHSQLGADASERARQDGAALTFEEAIAAALRLGGSAARTTPSVEPAVASAARPAQDQSPRD